MLLKKKKKILKKPPTLLWDHYYSCSYGNRLFVLHASSYIFQELECWKKGREKEHVLHYINSKDKPLLKYLTLWSKKQNTFMWFHPLDTWKCGSQKRDYEKLAYAYSSASHFVLNHTSNSLLNSSFSLVWAAQPRRWREKVFGCFQDHVPPRDWRQRQNTDSHLK